MLLGLHTTVVALFSSAVFMTSCNGQVTATAETEGAEQPGVTEPSGKDTAQVAEYIVAAHEDSKGNLWFGTNGQGVACWDGSPLRYFSFAEGLIGDVVTGIAEDQAGKLWFGTHSGATRYDPSAALSASGSAFTGFGSAEGLRGQGCKVLVDRNGTVWAGTTASLQGL